VFNRFNKHLEVNTILVPELFGFRKGIMIQKANFTLPDNILTVLNQQQPVGGIFFICAKHLIVLIMQPF
jgi:hypothetical protein